MGNSAVKRSFKFRFYPDVGQTAELSRTFGCVRKVYNLALAARSEAWARRERVGYDQTSAMLTRWKRTEELAYWSRPLPEGEEPTTVTVSRDPAGRWFVSMLFDAVPAPMPATTRAVGIDVGLTALVTLSTGEKVPDPKHERRDRERLARAQRALSRKRKGSANRGKARVRVARIHARIADRRRDHLHRLTTRLVRDNQTLVIEDITVRNLLKNRRLARAINGAAWHELRTMLEYKAAWYGRTLIVVDRWFPSSKLCSVCGSLAAEMPLSVREWTCTGCGATHDRDGNAAVNLLAAGLAVIACGAGVRPRRDPSRPGRRAVKQEAPTREGAPPPLREGGKAKQPNVGVSNAALPSAMPADTLRTSSQQQSIN
ncbi:RNA-guided endonuclease InsQ/TnpB family protein [Streptomyces sp. NPDC059708]|uniref:RNA-guided endonuclease InsQ/TnpB family protein n=1 Tax=Streptomyces sp. NPDC059708 TaxID=3346916 RepID=UPI0036A870EB